MIKNLRFYLFILPFAAFFISCSDSPTSVGENLIPNDDKIVFDEFDTYKEDVQQQSYDYFQNIKLGSSDRIILGKNSYAESSILLRFNVYLSDSLLTRFNNNELKITSAWVTMKTNYTLGNTSNPFDFNVYKLNSKWGISGFDKDSLKTLEYDQNNLSFAHSFSDTLIQFNMPTETVESWLKYSYDSTLTKNLGIILKPTPSTNKMVGFPAVYSSDGTYTDVILHCIVERYPNPVYKDTLEISPYLDNHVITGSFAKTQNHFYLQAGYAHRGVLSFDLTRLPKNIIVNKAQLELTMDPSLSFDGDPSSDSISVQVLADSVAKTLTSDSLYSITLSRPSNSNVYGGDLSWMVQKWIKGDSNHGIMMYLTDEYSASSLIALYNSKESDKALRPRLKITYTKK